MVKRERENCNVMEGIEHRTVEVNGIKMHIAEKGEGPVVLFLHGFPELWYSWRHQIVSLASRGYKAVAPDLRGFGDTDAPTSFHNYTSLHIVGDIIALIDTLGVDQVFVVGHDWGAYMAWHLCLFRPDRVKALVNLSVHLFPRNPSASPLVGLRAYYGDDFYMCRIQEPGEMEAEFARVGTETVIKKFLSLRDPDVKYFVTKFDKRGFTGGLNYYRAFDLTWELTAPWTGAQVKVPAKFIVGDLDLVYHFPGAKEYIHSGSSKRRALLQEVVVMEGVAHFIQQESPTEINEHIYDFIKRF
ncbi:hypothetical protein IFM89_017473 [Coptis chinensis]|uniref:AB hydrolase-1 domain-containing protein n=1 Tax=Coptis chinensis TaxID=261450 RepID=A0A835LW59_9MAGN|nr:hypothetical protein IFM89_017473 [Coptis chinensis]